MRIRFEKKSNGQIVPTTDVTDYFINSEVLEENPHPSYFDKKSILFYEWDGDKKCYHTSKVVFTKIDNSYFFVDEDGDWMFIDDNWLSVCKHSFFSTDKKNTYHITIDMDYIKDGEIDVDSEINAIKEILGFDNKCSTFNNPSIKIEKI